MPALSAAVSGSVKGSHAASSPGRERPAKCAGADDPRPCPWGRLRSGLAGPALSGNLLRFVERLVVCSLAECANRHAVVWNESFPWKRAEVNDALGCLGAVCDV